jgi:hypothetical protein
LPFDQVWFGMEQETSGAVQHSRIDRLACKSNAKADVRFWLKKSSSNGRELAERWSRLAWHGARFANDKHKERSHE